MGTFSGPAAVIPSRLTSADPRSQNPAPRRSRGLTSCPEQNMKFSPGTPGSSTVSRPTRPARRPSRARRPSLDLERCEQRIMLSVALVSVNSAGTGSANSGSDFQNADISSSVQFPGPVCPDQPERRRIAARFRQRGEQSGPILERHQPGERRVPARYEGGDHLTRQRDSRRPTRQWPLVRPDDQPQRPVRRVRQPGHKPHQHHRPAGRRPPGGQAAGYLYVRDLQTKTTTLLEQTPAGQAADGWSTGQFVFSPDSTKLAFTDTSDNLTTAAVESSSVQPDPWNGGLTYVYVRNLAAQTTSLVSVSTGGLASGDYPTAVVGGDRQAWCGVRIASLSSSAAARPI